MPNIEIKAKADLNKVKEIAKKVQTQYLGKLHQVDTYYQTKKGRFKLREINGKSAELIPYYKEYNANPMKSNYAVLHVNDVDNLKDVLETTLGKVAVVDKKREVFLVDNIRIHLDEVLYLGTFVEFEAVYEENSLEDKQREVQKVENLMSTFEIKKEDLLDKSYIDYLLD